MKKCIMFLILCAMLTGCGKTDKEAAVTTPAVSQETVTTTTTASVSETTAEINTKETKKSAETTDATAGKTSTAKTTKKSVTQAKESGTMKRSVKESKSSSRAEPERAAESRQTSAETPAENTTTKSTTASTTTTTTAKKPKSTTTTTTTAEEVEYIEIEDVTCLKTMVENLEDTDTPPSYYEKIGKGLKHDGTDYGKAVAVYKWMRKNGWGSCVYYSMETYFVCKGVGLECAYNFTTNNGWYGHTHNVVKVDGTWYVFDTQARRFLDNTTPCIRMFDGNDKDMAPFKEDIWYDYDENGEYRDWTISDS